MKRKIIFPPLESATPDGLVAVGGDLEIDTLKEAYQRGIFPWPFSVEFPLAWFSPDPRGIIELNELHLPASFKKFLKKSPYHITFNQKFSEVIKTCATVHRKNQNSTWITPDIILGYQHLFESGQAYSVEVWNQERLVGGIYGVIIGSFISGESMFSLESQASKFGLYKLLEFLKQSHIQWIDTQMVTSVVSLFGGKYISRKDFMEKLKTVDWQLNQSNFFIHN